MLADRDLDALSRTASALLPMGALDPGAGDDDAAARRALGRLVERLAETYPYHDARYAGQMLKPPHPVAWAAYATAMLLNPNNHALDGGPATARMEREAVAALAAMLGLDPHLGHLTSSGTIANLEALWVARQLAPGRALAVGENAHYTHARMAEVLGLEVRAVAQDARGRLDLAALDRVLDDGGVGTVVATLGTTALGALDPVEAIADRCAARGVRLHVDAAYGGFFALLADGAAPGVAAAAFAAAARADSVVVDPHKHGLQPYGCGCVLFRDPAVGRLYRHDSPYTYFTSAELHLGEISLECSRAGAAAAALWTTLEALPPTRDGLGRHLAAARAAALDWAARIEAEPSLELVVPPELDIVCLLSRRATTAEVSTQATRAFERLAAEGRHVALLRVDSRLLADGRPWLEVTTPTTTVLRSVLMKPSHLAEIPALHDAVVRALA